MSCVFSMTAWIWLDTLETNGARHVLGKKNCADPWHGDVRALKKQHHFCVAVNMLIG